MCKHIQVDTDRPVTARRSPPMLQQVYLRTPQTPTQEIPWSTHKQEQYLSHVRQPRYLCMYPRPCALPSRVPTPRAFFLLPDLQLVSSCSVSGIWDLSYSSSACLAVPALPSNHTLPLAADQYVGMTESHFPIHCLTLHLKDFM